MIRALIFDCFGVLYHGSYGHLRELTPPDRQQNLQDIRAAYDRGYTSSEEYLTRLSELIDKSPDETLQILRTDHVRNVPLFDFILVLKKDYKIALLTNMGRGVLEQLFSHEDQSELFDVIVESNKLRTTKPYPEIYEYTAAKLGLAPRECLMIDDLTRNILGAEDVGMEGVMFHTVDQLKNDLRERGITHA